jgi:hypothetical protein
MMATKIPCRHMKISSISTDASADEMPEDAVNLASVPRTPILGATPAVKTNH